MTTIHVGQRTPLAEPRRLALGVDKWMALAAATRDAGIRLPPDLLVEIDPLEAALASGDVAGELAAARRDLEDHGVLDQDGPVPSVATNLAALGAAPRRLRISLAGPGAGVLGYFWAEDRVGGSLVRDGLTHTLSLFDSRAFGEEVLSLLPGTEAGAGRARIAVPLDSLAPLSAEVGLTPDVLDAVAEMAGTTPEVGATFRAWRARQSAVLHILVVGPDRRPHAMVWFLAADGWWAGSVEGARPEREDNDERTLCLEPATARELRTAFAALTTEAWQ